MSLQAGTRFGPYELLGELGRGGMGVVYAASDTRLGRHVAIKVLPAEAVADPERRRRFMQEARAASALSHPNIAQVFDVLEDPHAIVMELVDGTPLDRALANGRLTVPVALDYAAQIAGALAAAHAAGIIHRDIKPANSVVAGDGRVKVLDFGLAKLADAGAGTGDATATSVGTRLGLIMGTAAYMSPEQAQGLPVDARTDIFSLGAVLYEMLAGRRPFAGDTDLAAITARLTETPAAIAGVPRDVDAIVQRALQKAPDARYPNAAAMRADLTAALARLTTPREAAWKRPSVLVPVGLALAAVIAVGTWQTVQARGVRWARTQAIPEMARIEGTAHTLDAVRLARVAERYAPDDVRRVRDTWIRFRITTEPAGATVEIRNYSDVNGAWEPMGTSPVDLQIPFGYYRVRLTKAGFTPIDASMSTRSATFTLVRSSEHEGMVAVPAVKDYAYRVTRPVTLSGYWIDRLEVTNRAYKTFVDAGGYRDRKYWTEPFADGDRTLAFDEAVARFRDTTGRTGPATWELGTFPEGQAEYPVGGISWFEAAAYARFAGKRLPTVYHWYQASGADEIYSDILLLSNFDGKGPVRAGERAGLGPWGTLDMAGNVKEWCVNPSPDGRRRYILGGGWNEPSYRFNEADAQNPWNRAGTFGLRLIEDPSSPDAAAEPIGEITPDPNTVIPVGDAEFELYKRFYAYDRTPLDAKVTAIDDSMPDWTKETLSFAAAYGNERVPAYFFKPKQAKPPYQTIVLFPSGYARASPSSAHLDYLMFDFLMRSGRAVLYPVYQGTFERRGGTAPGPNGVRDMHVQWAKDVFRAIDYLETRTDVDRDHLGYFSISMGAYFGPIPIALDTRLKAAVFVAVGLRYKSPPEVHPANFMPRMHVPTLLLNGRDDFSASPAVQQRVLDLLGTPADRKKRVVLEGGHVPYDRRLAIRETLNWFDTYLGPVK